MKVYTKTGDNGTTSLIGGERVDKCDLRVEAYGTVDELTAFSALLGDKMCEVSAPQEHIEELQRIISQLMTVAALLAVDDSSRDKVKPVADAQIAYLEECIDRMQAQITPVTKFTIPGGCSVVSLCHVCRTVCRRAERAVLRADRMYGVDGSALRYLNRLSDYFYVLGRRLTEFFKVEEVLWIP